MRHWTYSIFFNFLAILFCFGMLQSSEDVNTPNHLSLTHNQNTVKFHCVHRPKHTLLVLVTGCIQDAIKWVGLHTIKEGEIRVSQFSITSLQFYEFDIDFTPSALPFFVFFYIHGWQCHVNETTYLSTAHHDSNLKSVDVVNQLYYKVWFICGSIAKPWRKLKRKKRTRECTRP